MPLPCISTLTRHIRNLKPEFGFNRNLCVGLTEKLSLMHERERRGMIMFDEMQLSKHIDFRSDLGKNVGFVDFGSELTTKCQDKEGDHALVFLFKPFLGGWMQTIGSFCSAGTTPSDVLVKLILEAIILLENCGARVDGVVCDGASTNRKALSALGFSGKMGSVCNKMVNPCSESRQIFFFSDAPHLWKTVHNNLMSSKQFAVSLSKH